MVDRKVKGGKNRESTGVLKEHGQTNSEKGGGTVMLSGIEGSC